MGRLLRRLGLAPQRPLYRAYQQDPEAVARWKREVYPLIRADAAQVGAAIDFADEAAVRSDFHAGTTWAPRGQTPLIKTTGARFSVHLSSAVSPKGENVAQALPYLSEYSAGCDARGEEITREGFIRYAAARRAPDPRADETSAVPAEVWVQAGELYQLGPHRLLIASSTEPANLARLLGAEQAALLVTDPPYLADYTGGNHPSSWLTRPVTKDKTWDAYHDPVTGVAFYTAFPEAALPHLAPDAAIYQWHAEKRRSLVEQAWAACGLLLHQIIIWRKRRAVLGRSHFMWGHEPCAYGWRQGHEPALRPPAGATTVWEVDQRGESDGTHPTQKPVELFRRPIEYHTAPGDIVLDPFAGSGTAIIAAELTGRRAFCLEIEPVYAQAALERWGRRSGRTARRA